MKALPIPSVAVPLLQASKVSSKNWSSIGNIALLNEPLLGVIASRECPGSVLLETIERVPQWIKENRVILSGFHSPLEQQVMRSFLRRKGKAIKLLARGLTDYHIPTEEQEAMDEDRLLILTAFPPEARHTTRATALERNRLILKLATEIVVPHITEGSPLAMLLEEQCAWNKVHARPSMHT
ncbi:MAG: DNA-processing protein DprA [Pseudohongiellaceae bacterium]